MVFLPETSADGKIDLVLLLEYTYLQFKDVLADAVRRIRCVVMYQMKI
jgi:hypothetical protein